MSSGWWWLALAAGVVLVAWYLTFVATRLDRLHRRVEGAAATLDVQLLRRSQEAVEVSVSGVLDPASAALLHAAAGRAASSLQVDLVREQERPL